MPRKHPIHFVEAFGDTGYHVNDLGENKSPRFELYYEPEDKVILKTNNPDDCHDWIERNVWWDYYAEIRGFKEKDGPKTTNKNCRTKT